jgi:uncharacterized SAM-dependent methyltransferase
MDCSERLNYWQVPLVFFAVIGDQCGMSNTVNVAIHSSQSPDQVREDLLDSLRHREVHHKFHYESHKQSRKWLALHQAYSPSRMDPDCVAIYDCGFEMMADLAGGKSVTMVGVGCGGGQKDCRLIERLCSRAAKVDYIPADVSVPLVLVAQKQAQACLEAKNIHPLVGDFGTARDFGTVLDGMAAPAACRVLTFFGMIPNFEPDVILPRLSAWMRRGDWLLFSANLAPGPDYLKGVERVLSGYDNALTRDWLMTFLTDIGVGDADGELRFTIEEGRLGLLRIVARFLFTRTVSFTVEGEAFDFKPGDVIRLFYSYRHTPDNIAVLLDGHGLAVRDQWVTRSGEEGVFLCQKQ